MKNGLVIVTLSLLLVGCAQTAPDLDSSLNGSNNTSDMNTNFSDTVSIDESSYGNESSSNGMNSSSDGFKSIYFAFDKYTISSTMQSNMLINYSVAQKSGAKIKIEGNCDEFGTDEYNYALGLKRAKAVKDSIVSQGIAPAKMVIVSFGESNPVCKDSTNSCYDRNRRVDLHLVK